MDSGFESTAVSAINEKFQHGLLEPFYNESSAGEFNFRLEDKSNGNLSGTKKEEENQLDLLCDGVESALDLVHESLQGLTNFKDQLLEHALPPPLLSQLLRVTGKVFRSVTDFGTPLRELLRLVRVYSAPWDTKSAELIQLFERCSSLERQLDIAVRRLQQMDHQVKRVAREKSLLNWQKLFFKIMSREGQGSYWKLQIEAQDKAGQRLNQKQAQRFLKSEEEVDHQGDKAFNRRDLLAIIRANKESTNGEDTQKLRQGSMQDQALVPALVNETLNQNNFMASQILVQHTEAAAQTETTKPMTSDTGIWTQEPEFDQFLFVRIFCPEGLHKSQLKCSLSYRGSKFKTPELDSSENETSDKDLSKGRQRDIAERPQAARRPGVRTQPIATSSQQGSLFSDKRFYEVELPVTDSFVAPGKHLQGQKTPAGADTIKLAVHHGQFEEIVAFTTLNVQDLQKMKLETVCLPSPQGDDDVPVSRSRAHSLSSASSLDGSFSESMDIPLFTDHPSTQLMKTSPFDSQIINKEPQIFPLSCLQSGKAPETTSKIPLLLYWGKRVRPRCFNRQCGTDNSVLEMTPSLKDNESLSRETTISAAAEMVDEAVSVMACSSAAEEETVLKSDYDQMMENHKREVVNLHKEYEKKIEDLLKSLRPSHTTRLQNTTERNLSSPSAAIASEPVPDIGASHVDGDMTFSQLEDGPSHGMKSLNTKASAVPQQNRHQAHQTVKPSKNFKVGRSLPKWGENLPQDFFERLRMWQEGSQQHKQELNERTLKEIRDSLEKKLAGQHKLSKQEEQMYDALREVCLPALFMPVKLGNVYNPRAHQYFHATGSSQLRLTQPPSMFQLPPIQNNQGMSVMNLFELSKNFHVQGPSIDYLQQLTRGNSFPESSSFPASSHSSAVARPVISGEDNLRASEI